MFQDFSNKFSNFSGRWKGTYYIKYSLECFNHQTDVCKGLITNKYKQGIAIRLQIKHLN